MDPTTTGPGATQALVLDPTKAPVGDNVDRAKLKAIAVPHPLAVSGTPRSYGFDRETRVFRATWTTRRAGGGGRFDGGSLTTLAMPDVAYPDGYTVRVTGGRVLSGPDARTLVIAQDRGAERLRVVVHPG